jgi:hypothetical protein
MSKHTSADTVILILTFVLLVLVAWPYLSQIGRNISSELYADDCSLGMLERACAYGYGNYPDQDAQYQSCFSTCTSGNDPFKTTSGTGIAYSTCQQYCGYLKSPYSVCTDDCKVDKVKNVITCACPKATLPPSGQPTDAPRTADCKIMDVMMMQPDQKQAYCNMIKASGQKDTQCGDAVSSCRPTCPPSAPNPAYCSLPCNDPTYCQNM